MVFAILAVSSLVLFGASSLLIRLTDLPPSIAHAASLGLFLLALLTSLQLLRHRETPEF